MKVQGTGRGRRLGLTREKVVGAALAAIDRDGPDSFSLRKLAGELGVEVMSLYNHVPNKDALLDGVAETLLGGIDLSGVGTGTWQERARASAAAFRAAALRHPKAFTLVLTRPTQSPAALENVRCALAGFPELGLSPQELVHVVRSFAGFTVGMIMRELGSAITVGKVDPDQVRRRVEEMAAVGDPLLTAAAPFLAVSDHRAEFEHGIELLIAGLAVRVGVPYDGGPRRVGL
ncbi:TetR/AcrR family transcriptional regulator C-terminal domain-containing protein [Streptomyces sp. NPDC101175]|uniref:TetR/AcrR family transcriptional regulator C-terminal domain-containing protein n=1 Tax=Streptomyces sp. NPDC101175 TaxID=3366123 RepID=UPI0038389DB1